MNSISVGADETAPFVHGLKIGVSRA